MADLKPTGLKPTGLAIRKILAGIATRRRVSVASSATIKAMEPETVAPAPEPAPPQTVTHSPSAGLYTDHMICRVLEGIPETTPVQRPITGPAYTDQNLIRRIPSDEVAKLTASAPRP